MHQLPARQCNDGLAATGGDVDLEAVPGWRQRDGRVRQGVESRVILAMRRLHHSQVLDVPVGCVVVDVDVDAARQWVGEIAASGQVLGVAGRLQKNALSYLCLEPVWVN